MELDGHPTQDLIDELVRRGSHLFPGDASGPEPDAVEKKAPAGDKGYWLYVSEQAYDTEIDEEPPIIA